MVKINFLNIELRKGLKNWELGRFFGVGEARWGSKGKENHLSKTSLVVWVEFITSARAR